MALSLLDYNKALSNYNKPGGVQNYNNVLAQFSTMPGFSTPQTRAAAAAPSAGQVLGTNTAAPSASLLQQEPQAPSFDETPFNDILSSIDQLGGFLSQEYGTETQGIQQRGASQIADLNAQKTEAEQGFTNYENTARQDTEKNVNEQRRQLAEVQQGLQSRYGGTTGTGAFATELAGRQTLGNIGGFRQSLQNEYSKVNQMRANLANSYMREKDNINSQTEQLLQQAKNELNKQLAGLQIQKGQVNMEKSARRTQALQNFQSQVQAIRADNVNYLRQLDAQKTQIQNSLQSKTYQMTYQALQKALGFYDTAFQAGGLTDTGLRAAEQAYGIAGGSLQAPTGKQKNNQLSALEEAYGLEPGSLSQ